MYHGNASPQQSLVLYIRCLTAVNEWHANAQHQVKILWEPNCNDDNLLLGVVQVYNFCVAVDDATMGISHVLRAEEHLPNTLRQVQFSFVGQPCCR